MHKVCILNKRTNKIDFSEYHVGLHLSAADLSDIRILLNMSQTV